MDRLIMMFPGQGSQYVRMGKKFYDEFTNVKKVFQEANDILDFDLKKLCFEGDIKELTKTENAQPAILTASCIAFNVYMEQFGIVPICSGGHSLGEYSALTCSGVLSFADALNLVRKRGKFMQEAIESGQGAMAAVSGLDEEIIENEIKKISTIDNTVVISNYNSPDQIVISGHTDAVEKVSAKLKKEGGKVIGLRVSAPFHSPLMRVAAEKMRQELKKVKYNNFQFPVVSNVTALLYENNPQQIIEYLTTQIVAPVQWAATMKYFENLGATSAVEVGPQTILRNLIKNSVAGIRAYSMDKKEDVEKLNLEFQKHRKANSKLNTPTVITRCLAIAVCTRNHNWDNEAYKRGVSDPYKKIQEMQEEIEKGGKQPTVEQMRLALEMLKTIFATKRTTVEEQEERFRQIFAETGTSHLFSDFEMPINKIGGRAIAK